MKTVAEEAHEFVVRPHIPGLKKFAAFAYVAERFGYRYMGHAPGGRGRLIQLVVKCLVPLEELAGRLVGELADALRRLGKLSESVVPRVGTSSEKNLRSDMCRPP
ncbi:hypothetical protein [Streptomyces olivaceus]|uniref:hypothetical protein n=1 Tax=Streptomyces olivaceus TaxID=47716 RepID=UPI0033AD07B9